VKIAAQPAGAKQQIEMSLVAAVPRRAEI